MHYIVMFVGVIHSLNHCILADDQICLDNVGGRLMIHPDNTAWYIECRNGIHSIEICPELNVFNVALQTCVSERVNQEIAEQLLSSTTVEPSSNGYDDGTTTQSTRSSENAPESRPPTTGSTSISYSDTTSTTTTTTMSYDSITPPETSVDLLDDSIVCPCRDTEQPTYFASRNYCDKYFLCYRSRPLRLSCCHGHHWDQKRRTCIPEYQSQCGAIRPVHAVLVPECPDQGCTFYPHPTVCAYFYYCENGVKSVQQCDAFFEWDFYAQRCMLKSEARCITSIPVHLRAQFYV